MKISVFQQKNSKKIITALSITIFAAFGAYFVFSSRAANNIVTNAPAAPTVYMSPTSQTLGINETFTINIRENSAGTNVNAVQANFTYPTNLMEFVPSAPENQGIVFTGGAFTTAAEASVDTATGTIKIARAVIGGVTGDQQIASLTFKSKAAGGTAAFNFITGTVLIRSSDNSQLLPGPSAYGNASFVIDTIGPSVSITAPANNSFVEKGTTQTINVTASDSSSSVTKVEYLIDGTVVNTDTASPYSYVWNTASVSLGAHTIVARAYDLYGNTTTSSAVGTTVRDSIAPTVSITSPSVGATVSSTTTINANASDNTGGTGVARVEFLIDGTVVNTDTTSPYSYAWNTTAASDGNHVIMVKAYDNATPANVSSSSTVNVTVDNSDKTPPTAPGSLRSTGNSYTSINLAWNASTDNVGVAGYRLTRNGTQIYSGSVLTYNDTGLTDSTTYSYSVVAYDARGNVSTALLL
jgi:hypothetical protein